MSVEAMALVLHHSQARGAAKLVLVGIANHEGDGGAWPTVQTLSVYAGVNERNTRQALRQLEDLGELVTQAQAGGTDARAWYLRPNLYSVRVSCPPHCDRTSRHRCQTCGEPATRCVQHRGSLATGDVASDRGSGVASDRGRVSPATPKPSGEPSLELPGTPDVPTSPSARVTSGLPVDEPHTVGGLLCRAGWLGDDPDRPRPCPACRPHAVSA